MTFTDDELAVLDSGVQNIGIFFRLDTDPVVRLWLGFGNVTAASNVFDPTGAEYIGFGEIVNLPDFNQIINGAAERVEFTLSGVSGQVMQIAAANDADLIKGKAVSVGLGIFGADWQLLAAPHWMATYAADFLTIDQQIVTDPAKSVVRTITLSCGTLFTGRRRPSASYFSNADQHARHPGDNFCDHVTNYAHQFNKQWPVFS